MAIEFFLAKNGEQSAKANGVLLHSSYNPQAEGERFSQGANADFIPKNVIVLEAALGYCAQGLRKKYPKARLGCIRFCDGFSQKNKLWDFEILLDQDAKAPLSERLFDLLGEEGLFESAFFEWEPAARAWPEQSKEAWRQIKEALKKAKTVLATREHFGKRWLKNKVSFFYKIQNTVFANKIQKPVLVCASGPSLEAALDTIKKSRQKLFVCALSSAASVLAFAKIEPDLLLSSDGGFWAKKHLEPLNKNFLNVPLALEPESACPSRLLQTKDILPLCYDDDVASKKLFLALGIQSLLARRNGTVSGSALELFLANCEKEIFFCGLDLAPSKNKSHALPNVLENERDASDFRLRTKATRQAAAALPSESLKIYESWFSCFDLKGRKVFRIKGKEDFCNKLGQIKDINVQDLEAMLNKDSGPSETTFFEKQKQSGQMTKEQRARAIKKALLEWSESEDFCKELFPSDDIMLNRAAQDSEKEERQKTIDRKKSKLLEELFGGLK